MRAEVAVMRRNHHGRRILIVQIFFALFGLLLLIFFSTTVMYKEIGHYRPPVQPNELINEKLRRLPIGQVYHNIPKEMQLGKEENIIAGIAPKITQRIKDELKGKGKIYVKTGVKFNPSGVEMKLITDPQDFKVLKIRSGKQFVTSELNGFWSWNIIPLSAGEKLINIEASIDLKVDELGITRTMPFTVFSDKRKVKVNWKYLIRQFISKNWKEISTFVVGSGSIAGIASWLWARRKEKLE